MKKLLCVLGLCSLTVCNAFAQADGLEYSYFRAGYTEETLLAQVSGVLDDVILSGTALDFSMDMSDRWALIASHYSTDEGRSRVFDPISGIFRPVFVSQEFTGVGALYHKPLLAQTDLIASAEYATWEFWFLSGIFAPNSHEDENGYRLSLGLKSRLFNGFQGALLIRQFKFLNPDTFFTEDAVTDTVVEGNYHFMDRYSVGGSFIRNDDSERFVVNAGYSF